MNTISVVVLLFHAPWTAVAKIKVEGFEGGEVTFQCAHRLAWKYPKYVCKNMCKSKDVLVTVKYGETAQSGRMTLVDLTNGTFTVNISQLQLSDSGRYWCAVDRPGLDTFTAVNLTVKKVKDLKTYFTTVSNTAAQDKSTVLPDASSTWTYQNIFNTTQLIFEMDTSEPTNVSTTANCTSRGEANFSTRAAFYATLAAVSMLIILVFATSFRKCREIFKPQTQTCSNSRDPVSAHERQQVECKFNDTDAGVKEMDKSPERTFCAQRPHLNPPSSESTAEPVLLPIYENLRGDSHSGHSAANVHDNHDMASRIYIRPLPAVASGGNHTSSFTGNEQGDKCETSGSASCCDSTESGGRSLWFGLDLSGTI